MPPPSVGGSLVRMSRLRRPGAAAPASGQDSRAAILGFIEAAEGPVRVEDVAEHVGLHPNTVRGHLDLLLAAGHISRIPDRRTTRGRPHYLYSAESSDTVRELARALVGELELASASEVARRAAAVWAAAGPDVSPAANPDEAVDVATAVLSTLGFDAVRNPVGDQITLRTCPYADLVREHPVICTIHAELLSEILARTGQPVTVDALDVFPRPGMCVARLHRADAEPEWSVAPAPNQPGAQQARPDDIRPAKAGRRSRGGK